MSAVTGVSIADPEQAYAAAVAYWSFGAAAWEMQTGEPLWQYRHSPGMLEWLAGTRERIYFHACPAEEVICFDTRTGATRLVGGGEWNMASGAWIAGDRFYVHAQPREQQLHQEWGVRGIQLLWRRVSGPLSAPSLSPTLSVPAPGWC